MRGAGALAGPLSLLGILLLPPAGTHPWAVTQPSPTGCGSRQTKTSLPWQRTRCPRLSPTRGEGGQPLWDPSGTPVGPPHPERVSPLLSPGMPRCRGCGSTAKGFPFRSGAGAQGKPSQAGHSARGTISNSSAPSRVRPGWSCSQQQLTPCPAHGGCTFPDPLLGHAGFSPPSPGSHEECQREGNAAGKWVRQQPSMGLRWDKAEPGTSTGSQAGEAAPSLPDLGLLGMDKDEGAD